MKSKIGINFVYNIAYQILAIIVPLITSPYLARTLGPKNIGINSWTYSIVFYFMIFAVLGVNNYGNRTIASNRQNKRTLSKCFFSIYCCQLFMSVIMITLYILYLCYGDVKYKTVAILQIFYIIGNAFDITWFFYGLEEFKSITIRNSFVKIISLICIFIFVRNQTDLWKYTLIISGSSFLGQFAMWPILIRKICYIHIEWNDIKKHIKPIIILFVPVLAISVFSNMDKYMIGKFSDVIQSGYYENADKIIGIPKAVITALGTVMLPRTANLISNGEEKKSIHYIELTMLYTCILASAFVFGIMGVANVFSIVFWGENFKECGKLIGLMAPAILFSVFGNVIRTQFLIPRARDKEYTVSLVCGAVINFIINFLLIPQLGAKGAVIGTVVSEFIMTLVQALYVRKEISILSYIKNGCPFLINGLIMYICIYFVQKFLNISVKSLIILILLGTFVYCILSFLILKNSRNKLYTEIWGKISHMKVRKND